jgi:hypothetical protein
MTDTIEQLITSFRAQTSSASVGRRLDALIALESLQDERIFPFLLEVLADDRQPPPVRIHVLKRVGSAQLTPPNRLLAAEVIGGLIVQESGAELRLRAAIALGELTDAPGVVSTLGQTALDRAAPIDLRYAAFTSLERAGPTPACIGLLRQLANDDALGPAARRALRLWHH